VLGAEVAKRIEPLISQVLRSGEPLSEMEISEAVTDSTSNPRVWLISYYPVKVGDGGTATDDGEVQGVIAVVDEITKRKQAEADLRASEKRYRDIVDTQQEMVCRYLPDTTLTFVNEAYCRCFRRTREQLLGRRFLELIPEPARAASLAHVQSLGLEPGQPMEHEVTLPDGSIGWQRWTDTPICGLDNQLLEFQGVGVDITQRKRAEEALQLKEAALKASYDKIMDLAARLIVAQEEERTRIARNLHDDFNQEIAAISISISGLKRRLPEAAAELHEDVGRLQRDVIHLSDEIRHLSHELHPGVLRHAGLVAALRSRVSEFRSQSQIELSLGVEGDFQELPGDVSLCLYRAAQEALRNIDTHSGARSARIELRGGPKELELTIADDGKGFEPEVASATGAGLGLISLEERVRLIGGSLRVDAKPEQGTTLRIRVPLGDGHDGHDRYDGRRNI